MGMNERLIQEIRKRPLMFDRNNPDYKNLRKKEAAWKEVAYILGLNENQIKKRWKMLRDTYRRAKRLEVAHPSSSSATVRKKWKYYDLFSFLDKTNLIWNARDDIGTGLEFSEEECEGENSVSSIPDALESESPFCQSRQDVDVTYQYNNVECKEEFSASPLLEEQQPPICESNHNMEARHEFIEVGRKQENFVAPIPDVPVPASPLRQNARNTKDDGFNKFLNLASASISKTCESFVHGKKQQSSTSLLFTSLAAKLIESNMPTRNLLLVESKVSALVFSEIEKYLAKNE